MTNWLITGGCGFIGTKLAIRVRESLPGANIRILDNLSVGTRMNLAKAVGSFSEGITTEAPFRGIQLIVGDVRDYEQCYRSCQGMDVVVHLAANTGVASSVENPRLDMDVNVIGTFNMLEVSRQNKVKKFIFASSGASIGETEPPIHEEKAPKPVSPYGASKLAGEGYCSVYFRTYGLKTVALRFGNVYGPGSGHKNSVVAKFIKNALNGEPLEIYGDGNQTRDFIFIDDLVQTIMSAAAKDIGGETFQIASCRETTVNESAGLVCDALMRHGVQAKVIHGANRPGDVRRNYSDISKAQRMLEYFPHVDLKEGVDRTVNYFLRQENDRC